MGDDDFLGEDDDDFLDDAFDMDEFEDEGFYDEDAEPEVVCGICIALEQQQKEEA